MCHYDESRHHYPDQTVRVSYQAPSHPPTHRGYGTYGLLRVIVSPILSGIGLGAGATFLVGSIALMSKGVSVFDGDDLEQAYGVCHCMVVASVTMANCKDLVEHCMEFLA